MGLATREAELAKIVASGGLAPARCPGLIASLRSLRLAAPGAGQGKHTPAAARRSFAAASETLRAAQGRLRNCNGKQVRGRRSRTGAKGAAPRTLVSGGVSPDRGAARRPRARREQPRYAQSGAYEAALLAARAALDGAETAARRMAVQMQVDYDLIYIVMRLAPSFGRTRGKLRGAAGYRLEWPASRTRACLAEAEEAEETARCAWRASERSLRQLWGECRRVWRYTTTAEAELGRVKRMRAWDAASRGGAPGSAEERRREQATAAVAEMATALRAERTAAQAMLDHYYWGVWGSARRCRASEREVTALQAALREAEWGDWWEDLPGGSAWLEAAAAASEDDAQAGGGAHATHDGGSGVGVTAGASGGPEGFAGDGGGDDDGGCGGACGTSGTNGRQAADGGRAGGVRRGMMSGERWGLLPGLEGPRSDGRCRVQAAWEQAVEEQIRRKGLMEGEVEELAMCVGAAPVRTRLWLSWKRRRRRRLW